MSIYPKAIETQNKRSCQALEKTPGTSAFKVSVAGVAATARPVLSMYSCCKYNRRLKLRRQIANFQENLEQISHPLHLFPLIKRITERFKVRKLVARVDRYNNKCLKKTYCLVCSNK